jgi:tetratricopeptide (TPR) repeat protein
MGRILVQKKEPDKAITEFETAAKMNPNFTAVRAALADAYTQKKEFAKALATYNELAKIISDDLYLARIHSSKGMIYKQEGQRGNAIAEFQQALKLDKNNKEALAGLQQ